MELELDFVRALVKLMSENDLQELNLEDEQHRIRLVRGGKNDNVSVMPTMVQPMASMAPMPVAAPAAAAPAGAPSENGDGPAEPGADIKVILSPMVGTFYRSPSPDADPFIELEDKCESETTICIIEAMKVMNEIKSDHAGTVVKILVANGEAVEYGEPLFHVRVDD